MISVNELIQQAAEDLLLVGDGEAVSGDLAASCVRLLNRAIATLNSDSYISMTVKIHDLMAGSEVVFRKLEENEPAPANTVDQEPPDEIQGVSRRVGIRFVKLTPSNPQTMDRILTYSFPTQWSYGVETETAPSGNTRRIGRIRMNGSCPTELRIYENSALPTYRLGDHIYLSQLYFNLILYSLEQRMVAKYKLYSYKQQVNEDLAGAMAAIDATTAQNRPMRNDENFVDGPMQPADDLLAGFGF